MMWLYRCWKQMGVSGDKWKVINKTIYTVQVGSCETVMPRSHFGDRAYDGGGFKVPGQAMIHPAM